MTESSFKLLAVVLIVRDTPQGEEFYMLSQHGFISPPQTISDGEKETPEVLGELVAYLGLPLECVQMNSTFDIQGVSGFDSVSVLVVRADAEQLKLIQPFSGMKFEWVYHIAWHQSSNLMTYGHDAKIIQEYIYWKNKQTKKK